MTAVILVNDIVSNTELVNDIFSNCDISCDSLHCWNEKGRSRLSGTVGHQVDTDLPQEGRDVILSNITVDCLRPSG